MNLFFSLFFLLSFFAHSFNERKFSDKEIQDSSVRIEDLWSVDTVGDQKLRSSLFSRSSPLLAGDLVIQGNGINGVSAYNKKNGHLVWRFFVDNGVFGSLLEHKEKVYFGGSDGFFYSLDLKTGELLWKFFTGSDNTGAPLIDNDFVYFTAANHKLYALTLSGKLRWMYAGRSSRDAQMLRGRPRPVASRTYVYMGFSNGDLVALSKKTGKVYWKKNLKNKSIVEDLRLEKYCLLVPTEDYLYCIDIRNRKTLWRSKGQAAFFKNRSSFFYQKINKGLKSVNKNNRKQKWNLPLKDYPVLPSLYNKKYLIYGLLSKGDLVIANALTGKTLSRAKFGKGLASPVTVDAKTGDLYFFSVDSYLHKMRLKSF